MTSSAAPEFADNDFPVGDCGHCGRQVLAYVAYESDGGEALCCVHCDLPITSAARSASGAELSEIGYGLVEASGGGCGSGGCGSGQCGRMKRENA